ncbi:MAG: ABC transporter permease [Clostridiales bacterium]|nr:ABC transporter permease [Clostridiales bacterium]
MPEDATFIYEALEGAEHIDASMAFSIFLHGDDGNMHSPYLVVLEDNQTSLNFIDVNGNQVLMPEDGVLITPRMARALDAKIGDTVEAESLDGSVFMLNIANIVDFPLGNEIYISRTAFSKISSLPFTVRAFLFQSENLDLESLRNDPRIASVQTKEDMESSINIILDLLQSLQVIIIAFAGLLAFAVMMVLGRLNYHERIRELATLKVLGFHQKEMKRLVLRENIWIAVFGLPFGAVAGYGLLWSMMIQSTNPDMEIAATISIGSIVLACVLIFAFTLFVNYLLGRKFKGIDMAASLKSVE